MSTAAAISGERLIWLLLNAPGSNELKSVYCKYAASLQALDEEHKAHLCRQLTARALLSGAEQYDPHNIGLPNAAQASSVRGSGSAASSSPAPPASASLTITPEASIIANVLLSTRGLALTRLKRLIDHPSLAAGLGQERPTGAAAPVVPGAALALQPSTSAGAGGSHKDDGGAAAGHNTAPAAPAAPSPAAAHVDMVTLLSLFPGPTAAHVLHHIHAEAEAVVAEAAAGTNSTGTCGWPWPVKVYCDFDDTVVARVFDHSFPAGTPYPGYVPLIRALRGEIGRAAAAGIGGGAQAGDGHWKPGAAAEADAIATPNRTGTAGQTQAADEAEIQPATADGADSSAGASVGPPQVAAAASPMPPAEGTAAPSSSSAGPGGGGPLLGRERRNSKGQGHGGTGQLPGLMPLRSGFAGRARIMVVSDIALTGSSPSIAAVGAGKAGAGMARRLSSSGSLSGMGMGMGLSPGGVGPGSPDRFRQGVAPGAMGAAASPAFSAAIAGSPDRRGVDQPSLASASPYLSSAGGTAYGPGQQPQHGSHWGGGSSGRIGPTADLVFLSARPSFLRGHTLDAARTMGIGHAAVLCGTLSGSVTHSRMAARKLRNHLLHHALFSEFRVLFIGDSGQADVRFAAHMLQAHAVMYGQGQGQGAGGSGSGTSAGGGTPVAVPPSSRPTPVAAPGSRALEDAAAEEAEEQETAEQTIRMAQGLAAMTSMAGAAAGGRSATRSPAPAMPSPAAGGAPLPPARPPPVVLIHDMAGADQARITPSLERARLRAAGIHMFDSYCEAALVAAQAGLLSPQALEAVVDGTTAELAGVRFGPGNEAQRVLRLQEFTMAVRRVQHWLAAGSASLSTTSGAV